MQQQLCACCHICQDGDVFHNTKQLPTFRATHQNEHPGSLKSYFFLMERSPVVGSVMQGEDCATCCSCDFCPSDQSSMVAILLSCNTKQGDERDTNDLISLSSNTSYRYPFRRRSFQIEVS